MATEKQQQALLAKLKQYKRRYLIKKYKDLDESATRLMINSFLTEVLGYEELEEIKTEYAIRGTYADYVIQLGRKKHIVVEVKGIEIDLSDNHLRQAMGYAANEGIDWILLTNGRQFELYKVIFGKPMKQKKVFSVDLLDGDHLKKSLEFFDLISKRCMLRGQVDEYWKRFQTMEPTNLAKHLYSVEIVRFLRRALKKDASLLFPEEDIYDSIHKIIVTKIESTKPSYSQVKRRYYS